MIRDTLVERGFFETLHKSGKPLAVIVAGHNGSGKSSMWYSGGNSLSGLFKIPLINADRMMMSILPEVVSGERLPLWARHLRDTDQSWMKVAQKGVQAFVAQAIANKVAFATETVFSHWKERPDGTFESKVDLITELQESGYFVLLIFVGLASAQTSIGRVGSRTAKGGHDVPEAKLIERFPRTQAAIKAALDKADATILVDNSRSEALAFTTCHYRVEADILFDIRSLPETVAPEILAWLTKVVPDF